ncbi:glycosyltransferase involved in cell wall biosynthesis [Actinoplanes campanulatus]|uniref:Glycosyltransferase involved in cell wall biosynthesis n=1 Tax=Actinoplanes campanulatus TaxID=113559 RepID=A0A7W5FBS3_9ACTN|nr:glycosyltransferase involved in cell wall biosynthesis [Actinoplanes campanulatus]GGM96854.1 glycosyl transferase [Actinoplanes campanulatus]GID34419.1 glycosyl transferase [Actinoplanes campanulatus]
MRIAMISEPAGRADELAAALAELGHEVRVYIRRADPDSAEVVVTPAGVHVVNVVAGPIRPIPSDLLLPHMGEFARVLGEQWRDGWSPDVAHAHFWTSGLAAVTAAKQIGVPVVQSFHELGEFDGDARGPSRSGYERALGRAVDRVVAQTQDEVGELVRIGVPRARLTVIPSGVDSERFTPDGPAAPRDPELPRILSVGKLVERKGFGDVIQAMRYVPGAEVVVVGGPPPEQLPADPGAGLLRSMAEQFRVADRFRLVGSVPQRELPSWYRSADVLVAAPGDERSALEAMACGLPVVGTAVGTLTETVVDGLTGDLVPARDPRALGGALRRLINDKVRRFTYATAALDRARQAYSWKRVAAQIGSVYAGLRRSNATV